jgi:hypothetical protein
MEITRNMGRFQIAQNDSLHVQLFLRLIFNHNNGIAKFLFRKNLTFKIQQNRVKLWEVKVTYILTKICHVGPPYKMVAATVKPSIVFYS